jgi:hypothetical protein
MEILELINSPKPTKRFRITMAIGDKIKHYDFGDPNGHTFIDGADFNTRENYRKRHLANKTERERIANNIPSASLFAYKVLWGDSPDIFQNLINLNKEFADI